MGSQAFIYYYRVDFAFHSGAGVWHTSIKIIDHTYLLNTEAKDFLLKTIRAYEDLLGVEVLT